MKRTVLLVAVVAMLATSCFAQKAMVNRAKNRAHAEEMPNFIGAKDDIEMALSDPQTKDLANTWYVAGLVYEKAAVDALRNNASLDVIGADAMQSLKYCMQAYEMDMLPNAKGEIKPKLTKNLRAELMTLYRYNLIVNYGVYFYENQMWRKAIEAFQAHTSIVDHPLFADPKNAIAKDSTYYEIRYFAALCAQAGEFYDEAIAAFTDLKDKGYKEISVYEYLTTAYQELKDTTNFESSLIEAMNKYPEHPYFIGNLINLYAYSNKSDKAISMLNDAIARNPNNTEYYYLRGNMYEQMNDIDKAYNDYDKTIELDPNKADAWYAKGRLFYNKALVAEEVANNISDYKKIDNEMRQNVYPVYEQSLPFFLKALELVPTDIETMKTIRSIYRKLSNNDSTKYQALFEEIDNRIKTSY